MLKEPEHSHVLQELHGTLKIFKALQVMLPAGLREDLRSLALI